MKYGKTASILKPLDELTLPDPRISWEPLFQGIVDSDKAFEIHKRVSAYSGLHAGVPQTVISQFEVARNLMVYSYFVFEFQTQAELQAYAALEFAMRERLGHPTREIKRGKKTKTVSLMLNELLRKAIGEKLIQPELLPSWSWAKDRRKWFADIYGHPFDPLTAEDWLEMVVKLITDFRNHIAHGNPHLQLPNSLNQLELCADIINSVFQQPSPQKGNTES